jgi:ATP-dependent DNA helicase RecQ
MDAREALQRYFGFGQFRPGQEEIVRTVASGRDSLVVMPMGGGKSLCYQLPAMLLPGATLVVSPLIALMKDQVDGLKARGISADTINSSLSQAEQDERIRDLAQGRLKLLYVAPERFGQRRFVEALRAAEVSLVAVDEAHCVSQWGHDFRPDYLKVGRALRQIGKVPVAAFTATATPDVRADIVKYLELDSPEVFVTGFARENLSFNVVPTPRKADKLAHLRSLIRKHHKGIIYCATRKRVEEVYEHVSEWGVRVVQYHAGLEDAERSRAQDVFISGEADVAVATNAFGMGIDRADIRFVVHYEMPGSLEAYYQEAGRAGRDGAPAQCDFLYSFADKRVQEFFIDGQNPGLPLVRLLWEFLRRRADATGEVSISAASMAEALGEKNDMAVSSALFILMRARVIERFDIPGKRNRGTRLIRPDLDASALPVDEDALVEKERRDYNRLQTVIDYASSGGCRQEYILHYFGDTSAGPCGRCDWCLRAEREGVTALDEEKTIILRKALSGVARMSRRTGRDDWEGMFGAAKIRDMLCGKEKGPMREHGLDKLSTFGLLAAQGADFTGALLEECVRMGLLRKSNDDYHLVTLTPAGAAVMRGERVPAMQWPGLAKPMRIKDPQPDAGEEEPVKPGRRPRKRKRPESLFDDEAEPEHFDALLDELKKKRLELAQARGMKAFQILTNAALEAMARTLPQTRAQALALPGIGNNKADHIFPLFLPIIEKHASR